MGEGEGGGPFLVKRISLFARDSRDLREMRDRSEVPSSRVAPVAHVLLVSLMFHAQEQRIGDCSSGAHESCGLGFMRVAAPGTTVDVGAMLSVSLVAVNESVPGASVLSRR
jgi:hypothetical protein